MTEREILQMIFDGKQPPRLPRQGAEAWNYANFSGEHSINYPQDGPDWFGVQWVVGADGTQVMKPGTVRLKDLSEWKEELRIPDIDDVDWKGASERDTRNWDRENKMSVVMVQSGHFERLYSLIGFEEALMAFYDYPDELDELFEAITELKIQVIHKCKEAYHADIFSPHDDWGTNKSMFFAPEFWRRHIKKHVKRLVEECHAVGMLYEQHSCGHVSEVFPDLVEIGVDIAELQSCNDFGALKKEFGNAITLKACFNSQILTAPNVTPEAARKSVRETLMQCAVGGGFVGSGYGIPAATKEIEAVVMDEIDRFNREVYGWNGVD